MKPIPGRHRPPLPTPMDREFFQDIAKLVETQKIYESKIQTQIDKLSTLYYYVSCDIEEHNISKTMLALERGKYRLRSETNGYLSDITSHHQRIQHIVFQYPCFRLEGDSYLEIEANITEQIQIIIKHNNDIIKTVTEQRHKEDE